MKKKKSMITTPSDTWKPIAKILEIEFNTSVVDIVDWKNYAGRIVWADELWALQYSDKDLVRHRQTDFTRNLLPGMNVTITYPGDGMQCYLASSYTFEAQYKASKFRILVMQILGVFADHHFTDPLASFNIIEGHGCIKFSTAVLEGIECVYLDEIQSSPPGRGIGKKIMDALCKSADAAEVTMALKVKPIGNAFMNTEQLANWYKKNDFVKGGREYHYRHPQNSLIDSVT